MLASLTLNFLSASARPFLSNRLQKPLQSLNIMFKHTAAPDIAFLSLKFTRRPTGFFFFFGGGVRLLFWNSITSLRQNMSQPDGSSWLTTMFTPVTFTALLHETARWTFASSFLYEPHVYESMKTENFEAKMSVKYPLLKCTFHVCILQNKRSHYCAWHLNLFITFYII